jgi:phosphoribosyl-AMP cyclohydrolase / phosphoribosyl-ATP pyrophosphohydrolase
MKMDIETLDFEKLGGLIPAVVQDVATMQVLMVGFMNAEALTKTLDTRQVTFYSRTKGRLWTKGETSGDYMEVEDIKVDCDNDTLLVLAKPRGPVCHTGTNTCFGEDMPTAFTVHTLEGIIQNRKNDPTQDTSYTRKLLASGTAKIAQKVGEEGVEVVIEALRDNKELLLNESADLLYHLLVLLAHKDLSIKEVEQVLAARHGEKE